MKAYILIAVFLAGLISSCHKNTMPIKSINSGLFDAFAFKAGSYWIYYDSVSGKTDSMSVIYAIRHDQQESNYLLDTYDENIYIYQNDSLINRWGVDMYDSCFFISGPNKYSDYYLFNYPIYSGQVPAEFDSSFVVENVTYNVGSNTVSNVYGIHHFRTFCGGNFYPVDDWFYVKEGIGFVKIVLNHPADSVHRVMELQRYQIVL